MEEFFSAEVSVTARLSLASVVTSQLLSLFLTSLGNFKNPILSARKMPIRLNTKSYLKTAKYCFYMHSGWAWKALVFTLFPSHQEIIKSLLLGILAPGVEWSCWPPECLQVRITMSCNVGQMFLALIEKSAICTDAAIAWLCAAAGLCDFSMGRHRLVSCMCLTWVGVEQRMG